MDGPPNVGPDISAGGLIKAGCTKTHAVTKKPLAAVALIGTYYDCPVVFWPVTTTLAPTVALKDTRLEEVDHVIDRSGARIGDTDALMVAPALPVIIEGEPPVMDIL